MTWTHRADQHSRPGRLLFFEPIPPIPSTSALDLDALMPFMRHEHHGADSVLFREGDRADRMFIIQRGTVKLPDVGVSLGHGAVLGEIGIIHPDGERTGTAICETDVDALTIDHAHVLQLYYQSPEFGFYLLRLVTDRLLANARRGDAIATPS